MIAVLSGEQMKACDRYATKVGGTPSDTLMERAAAAAVEVLQTEGFDLRNVLIAVGSGNNGGDGVAMARMLSGSGSRVRVVYAGALTEDGTPDAEKMSAELREQFSRLPASVPVLTGYPENGNITTIVDAIFGIGVSRVVTGRSAKLIERINASGVPVLSVDLPSGIHSDTGAVMGCAVQAAVTVTVDQYKAGLWLYPGREYAGRVICRGIGIGLGGLDGQTPGYVLTKADLPRLLPARPVRSHKGTFGRVLVVAGSHCMAGAAYFSAKAAYRTGAGLVEILTPETNRVILQTLIPEAVMTCYDPDSPDREQLLSAVSRADAIVIGPGLGTSIGALTVLSAVSGASRVPTVLDADALNLLAAHREIRDGIRAPLILTPHPAEASRLSGKSVAELLDDLPGNATELARTFEAVCVLKDAATVTASPDGALYINQSGNSGMATGGSGDVLSGILGGLLATDRAEQRLSLVQAAALGVFLHGLAGDEAAKRLGEASVTASDILDGIPGVWKQVRPFSGKPIEEDET